MEDIFKIYGTIIDWNFSNGKIFSLSYFFSPRFAEHYFRLPRRLKEQIEIVDEDILFIMLICVQLLCTGIALCMLCM
jgi:hypothetical protein